MTGEVNAEREAVLRLTVRGSDEASVNLAAVIDTGFTDYLALPMDTISGLGLPRITQVEVLLGDGTQTFMPVFRATILWHGRERVVYVHGTEGGSFIGMALLQGSHVAMDVLDGGHVSVTPLR